MNHVFLHAEVVTYLANYHHCFSSLQSKCDFLYQKCKVSCCQRKQSCICTYSCADCYISLQQKGLNTLAHECFFAVHTLTYKVPGATARAEATRWPGHPASSLTCLSTLCCLLSPRCSPACCPATSSSPKPTAALPQIPTPAPCLNPTEAAPELSPTLALTTSPSLSPKHHPNDYPSRSF